MESDKKNSLFEGKIFGGGINDGWNKMGVI